MCIIDKSIDVSPQPASPASRLLYILWYRGIY